VWEFIERARQFDRLRYAERVRRVMKKTARDQVCFGVEPIDGSCRCTGMNRVYQDDEIGPSTFLSRPRLRRFPFVSVLRSGLLYTKEYRVQTVYVRAMELGRS
jgi:hypothetical protein